MQHIRSVLKTWQWAISQQYKAIYQRSLPSNCYDSTGAGFTQCLCLCIGRLLHVSLPPPHTSAANNLVGDMALSSPNQPETSYFSGPLLNVLLAHSSRFRVQGSEDSDTENAMLNALAQKAQHSLALRLTSASSISIVQALLQQSARDFAFGNSSQGQLNSCPRYEYISHPRSLALFRHGLSNRNRSRNPPTKRETIRIC